jgi:hypothetical protein
MPLEIHHNTPEQVSEYLREANRIVYELDLPDELQAVAFTEAVRLLASKQVTYTQQELEPRLVAAGPLLERKGH